MSKLNFLLFIGLLAFSSCQKETPPGVEYTLNFTPSSIYSQIEVTIIAAELMRIENSFSSWCESSFINKSLEFDLSDPQRKIITFDQYDRLCEFNGVRLGFSSNTVFPINDPSLALVNFGSDLSDVGTATTLKNDMLYQVNITIDTDASVRLHEDEFFYEFNPVMNVEILEK